MSELPLSSVISSESGGNTALPSLFVTPLKDFTSVASSVTTAFSDTVTFISLIAVLSDLVSTVTVIRLA